MNRAEKIIQKLNEFAFPIIDPLSPSLSPSPLAFAKDLWHEPVKTLKTVISNMPHRYGMIPHSPDKIVQGIKELPSKIATGAHMMMHPESPTSPEGILRTQTYGDEEHRGLWNPRHK